MKMYSLKNAAIWLAVIADDFIQPSVVLNRTWVEFNDHIEVAGPQTNAGIKGHLHAGRLMYSADGFPEFLATLTVDVMRRDKTEKVGVRGYLEFDPLAARWAHFDELEPDELDVYWDRRRYWEDQVPKVMCGYSCNEEVYASLLEIAECESTLEHVWGVVI